MEIKGRQITVKFSKRHRIYLFLLALFACALVFAGLKGWSHWKKESDFDRKVFKMLNVLEEFYNICILQEGDRRIIDNYVAYNKRDKPLGSWRMAYLYEKYQVECNASLPKLANNELLEGGELFGKYWNPFESWDEEPNYSYRHEDLCWNDDSRSPRYNETSVMTLVGEGTAFDIIQKMNDPYDYESVVFGECGSAILFIEAVDSGVHWGQPGDFDVKTVTKEQLFPGDTEGILVALSNREIWYVERTVPMAILKIFMTVKTSKKYEREHERYQLLSPYGSRFVHAIGAFRPFVY